MTNWKSKYNPANKQPQTPHPTRQGMSTSGTIMFNEAKCAAWQKTWNEKYASNWEQRGSKLYPAETKGSQ